MAYIDEYKSFLLSHNDFIELIVHQGIHGNVTTGEGKYVYMTKIKIENAVIENLFKP